MEGKRKKLKIVTMSDEMEIISECVKDDYVVLSDDCDEQTTLDSWATEEILEPGEIPTPTTEKLKTFPLRESFDNEKLTLIEKLKAENKKLHLVLNACEHQKSMLKNELECERKVADRREKSLRDEEKHCNKLREELSKTKELLEQYRGKCTIQLNNIKNEDAKHLDSLAEQKIVIKECCFKTKKENEKLKKENETYKSEYNSVKLELKKVKKEKNTLDAICVNQQHSILTLKNRLDETESARNTLMKRCGYLQVQNGQQFEAAKYSKPQLKEKPAITGNNKNSGFKNVLLMEPPDDDFNKTKENGSYDQAKDPSQEEEREASQNEFEYVYVENDELIDEEEIIIRDEGLEEDMEEYEEEIMKTESEEDENEEMISNREECKGEEMSSSEDGNKTNVKENRLEVGGESDSENVKDKSESIVNVSNVDNCEVMHLHLNAEDREQVLAVQGLINSSGERTVVKINNEEYEVVEETINNEENETEQEVYTGVLDQETVLTEEEYLEEVTHVSDLHAYLAQVPEEELNGKTTVMETEDGIVIVRRSPMVSSQEKNNSTKAVHITESSEQVIRIPNPRVKDHQKRAHPCIYCGKSFLRKSHMKEHLRHHTGEKPYQCHECQKCFSNQSYLNVHLRLHTGERPYQCSECNKSFTRNYHLKVHLRQHTGERPYRCSQCDKAFTHIGHLSVHRRQHTGERPYECPVCLKTFAQKSTLKVHFRQHSGERPYQCVQCDTSFTQLGLLKTHLLSHSGSRPFQCTLCDKTFTQKSTLNIHLKQHSEQTSATSYKCTHCDKVFPYLGYLKMHVKKHMFKCRRYECPHCKKPFSHINNLNIHIKQHSNERPHKCSHCEKSFYQFGTLQIHMRQSHGLDTKNE